MNVYDEYNEEFKKALKILNEKHEDYTLLDCCAWLSGYFHKELPDVSNLFDYIVNKDVFKKSYGEL